MTDTTGITPASVIAALEALQRGYSPIPITSHDKRPALAAWTRGIAFDKLHDVPVDPTDVDSVTAYFTHKAETNASNIGLLVGEPSGGLVDIDLDHPKTRRLKEHFLPLTPMRSGRAGNPGSHYWYQCEKGTLPAYRKFTMPPKEDGKIGDTIVEFRSTGGQTVVPPSIHPTGQDYRWE